MVVLSGTLSVPWGQPPKSVSQTINAGQNLEVANFMMPTISSTVLPAAQEPRHLGLSLPLLTESMERSDAPRPFLESARSLPSLPR